MVRSDAVVIGGGILGLATAWHLARDPAGPTVTVVEKERGLARHQSGRNSGVLHSGVYYRPGSLKAATCREGKRLLEAFCLEEGVAFRRVGKVVVATEERELPALRTLHERAVANGAACERIDGARLREIEPHCAGIAALHVPESGIVDYPAVCERLAQRIRERGGRVVLGARVRALREKPRGVRVATTSREAREIEARVLVNCAGLHADRLARMSGLRSGIRIVPFRGEYYALDPAAAHLCRALVYPVPDARFPFLGVHLTRMIDGTVECGPNAVLALAREGYRKTDVNGRDLVDAVTYPGFLRLCARYWRVGAGEVARSLSKAAFVRAVQRLVPEVRGVHLRPAPAGVRAQALAPDGRLVDDFVFADTPRSVHVLNAPSPAATASLQIGSTIAKRVIVRLRRG
jgi:L-2-hydroxyglutarate oxidase